MTEPTTDPGAGAREFTAEPNPGETCDDAILTVFTAAFEYAMDTANDASPYRMADDLFAALADAGYVIVAQRYRSVTVTHDLLYPGKTIIGSVTVDGVRLEADLAARPDGAR